AAIERRVIKITTDETCAEAEIASGLDEDHGEVATSARFPFQRLCRRLSSGLVPLRVNDDRFQGGVHVGEQIERAHRPRCNKAIGPAREDAIGVGIMLLEQAAEIDAVTARIDKGV